MTANNVAHPAETLVNTSLKTTSLCVARNFGKRHDDVLRKIERLDLPETYRARNFAATFRQAPGPNGATRQEQFYELTRDGFALLVMGFTGKRAMEWKIRFLNAFNAMEAQLRGDQGFNQLAGIMNRMSPKALDGFLRELKAPVQPDRFADLITYLDTRLLDMGLPGHQHEEIRSIRRNAAELREKQGTATYKGGPA